MACLQVCQSLTTNAFAPRKAAARIEVLFAWNDGMETPGVSRSIVVDVGPDFLDGFDAVFAKLFLPTVLFFYLPKIKQKDISI